MKEIKFVSHLTRNVYVVFIIFLALKLALGYEITLTTFLTGLLAYVVGYSPVYFLNDRRDWKEDLKDKKSNLYLSIKNKFVFWIIFVTLLVSGLILGLKVSKTGYYLLIAAYVLNLFHTFEPFRFRNRLKIGALNYFMLNIVKFFLVCLYLKLSLSNIPPILAIAFGSLAAIGGLFYKRYKQRDVLTEYIFLAITAVSFIVSLMIYPKLFVFLIPVIPLLIYGHIKYKSTQIPINLFQVIFFICTLIILLITSIEHF